METKQPASPSVAFPEPSGYTLTLTADNVVDAARALFWYANDYHGGQFTDLYRILSTSEYHPGPMESGVDHDDESGEWYRALETGMDAATLADSIKLILDTK